MKYIKKPEIIEAVQWTGNNYEEIRNFIGIILKNRDGNLHIKTPEGELHVSIGDYIIKSVYGEFYPCKPDIFDKIYTPTKTADEMFKSIGYEKTFLCDGTPAYCNDEEELEITWENGYVQKRTFYGTLTNFSYFELQATCKLLDEINEESERNLKKC